MLAIRRSDWWTSADADGAQRWELSGFSLTQINNVRIKPRWKLDARTTMLFTFTCGVRAGWPWTRRPDKNQIIIRICESRTPKEAISVARVYAKREKEKRQQTHMWRSVRCSCATFLNWHTHIGAHLRRFSTLFRGICLCEIQNV